MSIYAFTQMCVGSMPWLCPTKWNPWSQSMCHRKSSTRFRKKSTTLSSSSSVPNFQKAPEQYPSNCKNQTPTSWSLPFRTGSMSWKKSRRMTKIIRFWPTKAIAELSVLNSRKQETKDLNPSKDLSSALSSALLPDDFFLYVLCCCVCSGWTQLLNIFTHHTVFIRSIFQMSETVSDGSEIRYFERHYPKSLSPSLSPPLKEMRQNKQKKMINSSINHEKKQENYQKWGKETHQN